MNPAIHFDALLCADLNQASVHEWLETNGIGGFASSTIIDLNTRRYHALLTAAVQPPVGRYVLLSKMEEALTIAGKRYDLSANRYRGAVHPDGYRLLDSFRLDPFPIFTYRTGDLEIEKSIYMVQGENTVVVQYELFGDLAGRECTLELRPLVAFRDYHATTHANPAFRQDVEVQPGLATITPYPGLPSLHFAHDDATIDTTGYWFYNFEYERERERGLDYLEDLFSPFLLRFNLATNPMPSVIASTVRQRAEDAPRLEVQEIERREKLVQLAPARDQFAELLTAAADQFLVDRGEKKTVIAGYPWFGDWGRDTMISLPGLTLVTGRYDDARSILSAFAGAADHGMLPNRFLETGETAEYNNADGTLWMFHAVFEFLRYTRDYDFVRIHLYPALVDMIAWQERGTRYGIRLDEDGLLHAGQHGIQLTWMDAKIGDWVVTPRAGKPVEIQALWYNALRVMEHLAQKFSDLAASTHYRELAERARQRFNQIFWNTTDNCLYDVIGENNQPDASIRPNQIFAVSLPFPLLEDERALHIMDRVEWDLLTPYGLRTLSPHDPNYKGCYCGDQRLRDSAYHQGTVWPWLLGPFLTAYLRVHGDVADVRQRADHFLDPLRSHLWQAGLGQISEVFDGDPPHNPGGCIAQAWSVAEILRTYIEDIRGHRPASPDAS